MKNFAANLSQVIGEPIGFVPRDDSVEQATKVLLAWNVVRSGIHVQ